MENIYAISLKTKRRIRIDNRNIIWNEIDLSTITSKKYFVEHFIQRNLRNKLEFEQFKEIICACVHHFGFCGEINFILPFLDFVCFQIACKRKFKEFMCEPFVYAFLSKLFLQILGKDDHEFLGGDDNDNDNDNYDNDLIRIHMKQTICNIQTKNELGRVLFNQFQKQDVQPM
jgi:hypothetical protein